MTTTRKAETNIEMLTRLMTFSKHGALMQMFIIDALTKQAELVAALKPEDIAEPNGAAILVHPKAWIGVAQELKRELDTHFCGRGEE